MTLFELEPVPVGPAPTRGATLRARQQVFLDAGRHPIGGRPLLIGVSETCGGCRFRNHHSGGNRNFPKCGQGPMTHGPATDVKARWPACHLFQRRTG